MLGPLPVEIPPALDNAYQNREAMLRVSARGTAMTTMRESLVRPSPSIVILPVLK